MNARPSSSGTPSVSKYSGERAARWTSLSFTVRGAKPGMSSTAPRSRPLNGVMVAQLAERTPGMRRTRSRIFRLRGQPLRRAEQLPLRRDLHRENAFASEPEVDRLELPQAADEESRAGQQAPWRAPPAVITSARPSRSERRLPAMPRDPLWSPAAGSTRDARKRRQ